MRTIFTALCCLSFIASAPVEKGSSVSQAANEVENQEKELETLLNLADAEVGRDDVSVHKIHTQHVTTRNGQRTETDTEEKTVTDTNTGAVIADVKQKVSETEGGAAHAQPELRVETEVDIPADGVHQTITATGQQAEEEVINDQDLKTLREHDDGDDDDDDEKDDEEDEEEQSEPAAQVDEELESEEEDLAFNPEAVADYLYRTGDFKRFYEALSQLVNASMMTQAEAEAYARVVAAEYEGMQMEDYENSFLVERRGYPVDPAADFLPLESSFPVGYDPEPEVPVPATHARGPASDLDLDLGLDLDPADLLAALWGEAYGQGNPRAQLLVEALLEKVKGDGDPDDVRQVRDVLLDLIANSVYSERLQAEAEDFPWQPIADDFAPRQPIEVENVPAQPIRVENVPRQPIRENDVLLDQPITGEQPSPADQLESSAAVLPASKRDAQPMRNVDTKVDLTPAILHSAMPGKADDKVSEEEEKKEDSKEEDEEAENEISATEEHLPTQKRAAEIVLQP